jgi:acetyl-CoA carboxylase carboxyl transferase subunit alpha
MSIDYLDFEEPIAELQQKIDELRNLSNRSEISSSEKVDITEELSRLEAKNTKLANNIYSSMTPWQISKMSRHPLRPYTKDYISLIFDDFQELHGDRMYADDKAIIGGTARLEGRPCMVIGHQKGRNTKEKVHHNFGMPRPEGYRKAIRLMKLAERFAMPIFTFIDTPGAYPGVGAEERGQSEAIARNLYEMSKLEVPIVSTVIGEGGSGGALAIGVCDALQMLQYSTYSVISPEGCASILWKSSDKAPEAAEAMNLTADRLLDLGIVDQVIEEPLGGAHRDVEMIAARLKTTLINHLDELLDIAQDKDALIERRYQRLLSYGRYEGM